MEETLILSLTLLTVSLTLGHAFVIRYPSQDEVPDALLPNVPTYQHYGDQFVKVEGYLR